MANSTLAKCGHRVFAVGSPGSEARLRVESMPCPECVAKLEAAPEVTDAEYALAKIGPDLAYALDQLRFARIRLGVDDSDYSKAIADRVQRALDALERIQGHLPQE